ncbi:hypothetical protein F2Q69_00043812 [Brassica cretica]|uniref:Uncharacterized protein n=1 Tax=Brassica cretica TaxID=69181 RepID=A0A8S9NDA0_BRACR|nr:hypothetical protein F2Q69_00043812 [Brassica cretica]
MLILPVTFNKNFIEHTNSFLDFDKLRDFTLSLKRSKQSFRFADTPVSLLFEEVPERIKLYPQGAVSVSRLRGVDVGDDNPGHDMAGAGAVTTDSSQSVKRGIHDNRNRPSNHVMVESHPCFI